MNEKDLGRRVRATRRKQGLRQDELAALCGVGTRFVSELENGKPGVELGRVLKIMSGLGLELIIEARDWRHLEQRDGQ